MTDFSWPFWKLGDNYVTFPRDSSLVIMGNCRIIEPKIYLENWDHALLNTVYITNTPSELKRTWSQLSKFWKYVSYVFKSAMFEVYKSLNRIPGNQGKNHRKHIRMQLRYIFCSKLSQYFYICLKLENLHKNKVNWIKKITMSNWRIYFLG